MSSTFSKAAFLSALAVFFLCFNLHANEDIVWEKTIGIESAFFSPDGSKIYATDGLEEGGYFYVLETETGEILQQYDKIYGNIIGLSADGEFAFTLRDPGTHTGLRLHKVLIETYESVAMIKTSDAVVNSTGTLIALKHILEDDYSRMAVILVNPETFEIVGTIDHRALDTGLGDYPHVRSMALSPDGKTLATVLQEGYWTENNHYQLILWSCETFELIETLYSYNSSDDIYMDFESILFSPNSEMLSIGIGNDHDETYISLFDTDTFEDIQGIECINESIHPTWTEWRFDSNTENIVISSAGENKNSTQTIKLLPCEILYTYEYPIHSGGGIFISPDNRHILSQSYYEGPILYLLNAVWDKSAIEETDTITQIYPNPTSNTINLEIDENTEYTINITVINGNIIYTDEIVNQSLFTYDVSALQRGVYYIQLISKGGFESYRFVRE